MRFMLCSRISRMNWAWATSLDQAWRSPAFPMWLTLVAAAFFGLILFVTLLRAEKSVANGALTVITLLAIGVAVASTIRTFGPAASSVSVAASAPPAPPAVNPALPALSCVDDLAGETVLAACEKVLFGSAESTAAAVSYAAARLTRLTSFGDVATADKNMTPDLATLRRSVESDRYGLIAHVLLTRDHCTPAECVAFSSLTDHSRIVANMDQQVYDGLVSRYAPSWNAPVTVGATTGALAALPPSVPTGRPVNIDFPSASSTPAVSIMNPEPGSGAASTSGSRAPAAPANPPPRPTAAAKKPAPKPHAAAPVQIVPPAAANTAPAASNE
jgi:hypothetical protein